MTHSHSHRKFGTAFGVGIALNSVYVAVEFAYGYAVGSTALVADAGHNASDVFGLVLAWGAMWIAAKPPSRNYTYVRPAEGNHSCFNV